MQMSYRYQRALVWMRRDLRLDDNAALLAAARESAHVACAFVLDPALLRSDRVGAPIVQFFFDALVELRGALRAAGSDLILREGDAREEIPALARELGADAVHFNEDYEPAAIARDAHVGAALRSGGVHVGMHLDHVYFGADEIVQQSGKPYVVFTPYRRRWDQRLAVERRLPYPSREGLKAKLLRRDILPPSREVPQPSEYGFTRSSAYPQSGETRAGEMLAAFVRDGLSQYGDTRNTPAVEGTSQLSPHLRAGTIGIRTCVDAALRARSSASPHAAENIAVWISELAWRDFYQMILRTFPRVADGPFVEAAANLPWRDDEAAFAAWCAGTTGYPIVDAAMMQLNETGWMHNRLRMIVASFLTKHLLIDWRKGERYFEQRLADADLAANNGGWQWSASTGNDGVPYFRVFNPIVQGQNFDPDGAFVRRMLPALARVPTSYVHKPWEMPPLIARAARCEIGEDYPAPIVDHKFARERALATYAPILGKSIEKSLTKNAN